MEIDVTPAGNTDINSFALCHVEQENFQSSPVDCTAPASAFGTQTVASKDPLSTISNKKTIKHALRQQAKRRKRNTIASNNSSASVPRILVKRLPPDSGIEDINAVPQISSRTPTMKEVLASIPGFNMKTRKRTNKKLSTAAQLEQTKAGCIDLETPDSILVNTNLRLLLNKGTFASLPVLYQNKLSQLLPLVDRQLVNNSTDPNCIEISSGLNNEFFARACLEWQDRLAEGEFTPENQQKLKLEADKERSKLDPWKLKHFEPIWGDRSLSGSDPSGPCRTASTSRPSLKTTIKLRPSTTSATSKSKAPPLPPPVKKLRTVGAMTRSCTILKEEISKPVSETKSQIPDLLPIKQVKSKVQSGEVQHKAEEVFVPETAKDESEEAKPTLPSDIPAVEIHDNCIVNISDAILENNQETIIICREDITTESEKRPRSASSDSYENSPKRSKSMSPLALSPEPADRFQSTELKDPLDITCEAPSDDEKVSEPTLESTEPIEEIYDKDRIIDDNSSSSCSMPAHNLEETSSSQVIETVDSLQLHMNYIDEEANEISQVDDNSSSTSATSSNTDVKSEQESEMTQDQDDTMTSIPEVSDNAPCESETNLPSISSQETNSMEESKESFSENMQTLSKFCHSSEQQPEEAPEELAAETNLPQSSEPDNTIDAIPDTSDHVMEEALPDNFEQSQQPVEKMEQQIHETFQMLPNSLIIQQESLVLQKPEFVEDIITEVTAEKLEASVEEADLVSFAAAKIIQDDDGEDRFMDAENYVLESGQITVSTSEKSNKKSEADEIQATLFGDAVTTVAEECCWGLVDSSTENLLQVPPLHSLGQAVSVPVSIPNDLGAADNVQVIPMQEELEVRLEQGTFPVPNDWPYDVKMDSEMVEAALGPNQNEAKVDDKQSPVYPDYSQVKLELEVTLTPEIASSDTLITSTVTSNNNDTNLTGSSATAKTVTTVIPPTTIVCLPSAVSTAPMQIPGETVQCGPPISRPGLVQSSSALPYLALSTSQPIRAVPTHSKNKPKTNNIGSRNRANTNKPPPGAVNLERSYQICQAVIQNSPNRDQLKCQLKPPPSLLAAAAVNNSKKIDNRQTQYSSVTSSRGSKTFTPPLPASGNFQTASRYNNGIKPLGQKGRPGLPFQQRQASPPVVVRHVFTTSGQGIPVTMAVLPQGAALSPEIVDGQNQVGAVGQYILVQRTGVVDQHNVPRSSSAPPAQQPTIGNAINTVGMSQLITGRGRPASVEADHPTIQQNQPNDFVVQCPNPGTQAVTRRQRLPPGVVYGDVSIESHMNNYTIIGENVIADHPATVMQSQMVMQQPKNDSCACSLKAMVVCKKCGAFCHDDCIGPNKLCRTCFIR
ncbi:polycomb protein Asx isoform X2 [Dendroctonus ponderosae]|uniref:polycomb protein Asx isoform X2 n=1 Tax=Dendroctonus ponderosae TaxID=77166 RepID=UPI002035EB06|nr:polycomb protein Asx isoform X2 [Dendroctonus ponderosae]